MKIKKIMVGAVGAVAAAGAVSGSIYAMRRKAALKARAERLAPKEIIPKSREVLSDHLTPDYLRFGGTE